LRQRQAIGQPYNAQLTRHGRPTILQYRTLGCEADSLEGRKVNRVLDGHTRRDSSPLHRAHSSEYSTLVSSFIVHCFFLVVVPNKRFYLSRFIPSTNAWNNWFSSFNNLYLSKRQQTKTDREQIQIIHKNLNYRSHPDSRDGRRYVACDLEP